MPVKAHKPLLSSPAYTFVGHHDGYTTLINHEQQQQQQQKHQKQNNAKDNQTLGLECQCECFSNNHCAKYLSGKKMKVKFGDTSLLEKYANIKWLGVVLFILASVFCVYKIINLSEQDIITKDKITFTHHLKLVSVFNRHGDRSPSDGFPRGDPTPGKQNVFWPNGNSNLTDVGKFRQYKIGLELQRRYEKFIDFDPSHYLAFSSPVYRCQASLQETLRGLFENEWSSRRGLEFVAEMEAHCRQRPPPTKPNVVGVTNASNVNFKSRATNCSWLDDNLPNGSGSPKDWQKIPIDIKTIPALTYEYLNHCPYRLAHPTKVDVNLFESEAIRKLPGAKELAQLLLDRYNQTFDYDAMTLWSTFNCELRLVRTKETLEFGQHYYDWIGRRLPEYFGKDSPITLFDIYEQVSVFGYRDRLNGKEINQIQLGPLLSSLVQSQLVALNQSNKPPTWWFLKSNSLYTAKKMIFYSGHDSILQLLMQRLNLVSTHEMENKSYEWRFNYCSSISKHRSDLDVNCYLSGLRMAAFGMSLVFELWESKMQIETQQLSTLPYIKVLLYYQEDGRFHSIDYRTLPFGSICRRWFKKLYPSENVNQFYDKQFRHTLDYQTSCPFELFRNLTTSELLVSSSNLKDWCGYY